MSTNVTPCPEVEVLRWNARSVYVKCCYCEEVHRHGFTLKGKRTPHCAKPPPGDQYEFIFPIHEDTGLVGYEIDKRRGFFVNVGAQTKQAKHTSDDSDSAEDELGHVFGYMNISATEPKLDLGLNLHEDSEETDTIPFPGGEPFEQKRILSAISDCVRGKVGAVSEYLSTSTEAKLFLHGKDRNGDTTLIMAAAEESQEMVSLLVRHGADVDAANNNGRSPLMEAALWGRVESVKVLLNAKADKLLRDNEGHGAIDLARPSRKIEEEVNRRCFHRAPGIKRQDRQFIVLLLSNTNTKKLHKYTAPLVQSHYNNYRFNKSEPEGMIRLLGPIGNYPVSSTRKTAAYLDRGDQFRRVFYIASTIGHELESSCWDAGTPGKYYACHAEKKLVAYFIDRHVFLPQDEEPNEELENSIWEKEAELEQGKGLSGSWQNVCSLEESELELRDQLADARIINDVQEIKKLKPKIRTIIEELETLGLDPYVVEMKAKRKEIGMLRGRKKMHDELMDLSGNEPPISLKQAVILSSNMICDNCEIFKDKVNMYFDLDIKLHWCT
ncbi:hypothetical protein GGS20DRAFT_599287 [Poronia punctata]|nr:hypothetical protein GGS20DRAFT_599287 [Poronia punctata]